MTRAALLVPVFAGGALGGLVRVALGEAAPTADGAWPWVTFAVNLAGALILGATAEALQEPRSAHVRLFLGTGFCGGLTTFSTLQVELLDLAGDGHAGLALTYAVASVLLGLAAVFAGARASRARTSRSDEGAPPPRRSPASGATARAEGDAT